MAIQMDIRNLIILTIILYIIYYTTSIISKNSKIDKFEHFGQSKECSRKSINDSYTNYIFGGVKSFH